MCVVLCCVVYRGGEIESLFLKDFLFGQSQCVHKLGLLSFLVIFGLWSIIDRGFVWGALL